MIASDRMRIIRIIDTANKLLAYIQDNHIAEEQITGYVSLIGQNTFDLLSL